MANDNRKLDPVALSTFDEIEDASGFWIFGSREEDGILKSGKYLFDNLAEYAKRLQLERRISLRMETNVTDMFIGEEMTIYKIEAKNVSELKINGVPVDLTRVGDNTDIASGIINLPISKYSKVTFEAERQLTDVVKYVFVYGKAKMEEV